MGWGGLIFEGFFLHLTTAMALKWRKRRARHSKPSQPS